MNLINVQVTESEKGFLTVTKKDFLEDELILSIKGVKTTVRDKYTIQSGFNVHTIPDDVSGKYINHSCFPNTIVNDKNQFVALRNIKIGEELTFDYETTEDEIAEPFDCFCGAENCRRRIAGNNNID